MTAHLTEEEQIEALKRWWKENGKGTVLTVAVLLSGFFGWNQYKDQQAAKASDGSVIFEKFVALTTDVPETMGEDQSAKIQAVAAELIKHNEASLYSDFAQMYVAKLAIEKGELDSAIESLENVSNGSGDSSIQELARLRLARLLSAKGDVETALSTLAGDVSSAYKAAYEEAKGDILLADKRVSEAHKAYQAALDLMGVEQMMRKNLVQLKLDHSAVASEVESAPATPKAGDV